MVSVGSKSEFGYTPALAIFDKPSVDTGVVSHKWIQYRPVSQISNTGKLEFIIPGTANTYINLKCSTLQIEGKIVKADGSDIADTDLVSLKCGPLHSYWSQVDLALQGKVVTTNVGTNYAYKAYLDLLLDSTQNMQQMQFASQMFQRDMAGQMDKMNDKGVGFILRFPYTKGSRLLQLEGPLCLDLAQQERYIINGVEIHLKLWPNKAPFYLGSEVTGTDFQFKLSDACLNVCTVEVSPAILVGHAAGLKISPAFYPYFESDMRSYSIAKGSYGYTIDNMFQGDIPADITLGLVTSEAYSGDYSKNPYNFQHFHCNFIGFYVDGNSVPGEPLQPKYRSTYAETDETKEEVSAYTDAYLSLFGHNYIEDQTPAITMNHYPYGYCLYRFRISEHTEGDDFISLPRRGHTQLKLKFKKALEETTTLIMYAHFPRSIRIDEARNVLI